MPYHEIPFTMFQAHRYLFFRPSLFRPSFLDFPKIFMFIGIMWYIDRPGMVLLLLVTKSAEVIPLSTRSLSNQIWFVFYILNSSYSQNSSPRTLGGERMLLLRGTGRAGIRLQFYPQMKYSLDVAFLGRLTSCRLQAIWSIVNKQKSLNVL